MGFFGECVLTWGPVKTRLDGKQQVFWVVGGPKKRSLRLGRYISIENPEPVYRVGRAVHGRLARKFGFLVGALQHHLWIVDHLRILAGEVGRIHVAARGIHGQTGGGLRW